MVRPVWFRNTSSSVGLATERFVTGMALSWKSLMRSGTAAPPSGTVMARVLSTTFTADT